MPQPDGPRPLNPDESVLRASVGRPTKLVVPEQQPWDLPKGAECVSLYTSILNSCKARLT